MKMDKSLRGMDDWVLDSLVGFLKSPTWSQAISRFVDKNCVVFDPGEENKFSYTDIHKEYQKLVEGLLETFTTELGISGDQFTHACSLLQSSKTGQENEELFEQILAADDFLLFKSNMVRRNIDLELQALTLLKKQVGHSPQAYDKDTGAKSRAGDEDKMLEEAVKLSEAQFEYERSMDEEELKRMIEQAKRESLEFYRIQQESCVREGEGDSVRERIEERGRVSEGEFRSYGRGEPTQGERMLNQAQRENDVRLVSGGETEQEGSHPPVALPSSSIGGIKSTGVKEETSARDKLLLDKLSQLSLEQVHPPQPTIPVEASTETTEVVGGEDAMMRWLEAAKTGLSSEPSNTHSTHNYSHHTAMGPTPEQLRARELYLKQQRDHLLEAKKKQDTSPVGVATGSGSRKKTKGPLAAGGGVSSGSGEGVMRRGGRSGKDTGVLSSAIAVNLKKSD